MNSGLSISRRLSLFSVMQTILHKGPISRASMARETGLSKQTIGEIALALKSDGWIHEKGRTTGHVGRSATNYEIVPEAACIAAVDLGGTRVRAVIADLAGSILEEMSEPTSAEGGSHVVSQVARLCREAARRNRVDYEKVKLAVVGVAGVPDELTGRVKLAPNIVGIDKIDFRSALSDAAGVPVSLENDVNLAIIGEHWIGRGRGEDNLVFVALGTGIGSGIMVDGNLVRGSTGAAGELAYLPLGADPFESESLQTGALERVAGSHGIIRRYRLLSGREADVPEIFELSAQGDSVAARVLDETARHVVCALSAICAIVNPAKVILGGSIGERSEFAARVRELVPRCAPAPAQVEISSLGSRAALAGGAAVGLQRLHTTLFSGGINGLRVELPHSGEPDPLEVTS